MTKYKVATVLAGVLLTTLAHSEQPLSKRPYMSGQSIAIIGAGVSGLSTARALLEQGVDARLITVIESNPQAGGKVDSVQVDGRPYELGAMMIIPHRYAPIEALAKKYNLSTRPVKIKGMDLDITTGKIAAKPSLLESAEAIEEFKRYYLQYKKHFSHLNDPKGFSEIPAALQKSWPDFVRDEGYQEMDKAFASILSASGFLRPEDPPQAAQVARMLSPDGLFRIQTDGIQIFNGRGYQQLWLMEAADLAKSDVTFLYNSTVSSIQRNEQTTSVLIKGGAPLSFDHVMYTGNLEYLPELLDQASPEEVALYKQVTHYDYRSYIMHIKNLPVTDSAVINFVPTMFTVDAGRPILAIKPYADTDVYVVYAYGTPSMSDDTILANIKSDIAKFPGASVGSVESKKAWTYFPHVSIKANMQTFFNSAMNEEGRGGVWFTGEATSYTATIEVYEAAQGMTQLFLQNKL